MNTKLAAKLAWALLIYSVPVIVFGAYVRASISGDGCGNFWPGCQGQIIPLGGSAKTFVEWTHRVSDGVYGLLTIALCVACFRAFPKGSAVRKAAAFTTLFMIIESAIGAILVKKQYVAHDSSPARAVMMSLHLTNTFLLLASVALTAVWASGIAKPKWKGQGAIGWAIVVSVVSVLLLGISGAVAALGDTLYPVKGSIIDAVTQDFSSTSHFLIKLRVFHPMIATSVGILLILLGGLLSHLRPSPEVKRFGQLMVGVFIVQMAFGVLNLLMKAPIWMQLVHLLIADVVWISLVMVGAFALAEGVPHVEDVALSHEPKTVRTRRQIIGEYISLTKPRVISLLLFTTLTAMFIAARGWPGLGLFLAVAIGGYLSAGAANTINMVIDRDIDGSMKRTSKRPTVTQNISSTNALLFGFGMAVASFAILWGIANLLTAMLSLAGLAFYVVIYTLWLKRRTWQNIVIGGAAGAFPPLVGWASVTNELTPLAWLLFGIIFLWTPVHFWALALLIKDDYAEAGVPMLPVVHGERATVIQIALYAVLTAVVSVLPVMEPRVGWPYLVAAIVMNVVLFVRCMQLYQNIDRPRAVTLYKFSMLYLAVIFLSLAVSRSISF